MEITKEKYDYYYDSINKATRKPIVTVCYILLSNGNIGRGMSICSRHDELDGRIGKEFAKHNAIRALKRRKIDRIVRKGAIEMLVQARCPFMCKGELNPALNWYERKLLFGKKEYSKKEYSKKENSKNLNPFLSLIGPPPLYNCRCL